MRPAIRLPAQANQGPSPASGTGKPGCCCMPRLKNKFLPSLMQKVWSAGCRATVPTYPPSTARLSSFFSYFRLLHSILLSLVGWLSTIHHQPSLLNGLNGATHASYLQRPVRAKETLQWSQDHRREEQILFTRRPIAAIVAAHALAHNLHGARCCRARGFCSVKNTTKYFVTMTIP